MHYLGDFEASLTASSGKKEILVVFKQQFITCSRPHGGNELGVVAVQDHCARGHDGALVPLHGALDGGVDLRVRLVGETLRGEAQRGGVHLGGPVVAGDPGADFNLAADLNMHRDTVQRKCVGQGPNERAQMEGNPVQCLDLRRHEAAIPRCPISTARPHGRLRTSSSLRARTEAWISSAFCSVKHGSPPTAAAEPLYRR